jgi:U3 small nucleolar RNA-associated protein 14
MTYARGKIAFRQTELINRAFAADGFEQDFAVEKEAAIAEDAPKEEDLTLPGWGAWTGQGVKRRATEKKLIKKIPGIEESKRKDAKLKHVIINEKRAKNVLSVFIILTVEYEVFGIRTSSLPI